MGFGGELVSWFWLCAIGGTVSFGAKFIFSVLGGLDHDLDFDSDLGTDQSFGLLSITTIAGFLMMFGWSGLAASEQFNLSDGWALGIALLCGSGTFFSTSWLVRKLKLLGSGGEAFRIEDTLELIGTVYQKIPAQGIGKIQVNVNEFVREIQAFSDQELDSGRLIKVESVLNSTTVKVVP